MKTPMWLLAAGLVLGLVGAGFASQDGAAEETQIASQPRPAPAQAPGRARQVQPAFTFGMQYVPKFDESAGKGAWHGSRDRGMRFHQDLGVQVSREGFIWRHYETEDGKRPNMSDFDDIVDRLDRAGIAMQAMVTETPLWASTASKPDPKNPASYRSGVPKGLHAPIFTDGSDTPGPGKTINPANTWARTLDHMVTRYKGQVRYWQMWNEPDYPKGEQTANDKNLQRSWFGSVDDYVRLLKVGHILVKWHDPEAQVVTGGIGYADYLQAMLDRGAGRYFDQIDFHAYGWPGSDIALKEFKRVHDEMKGVLVKNGLAGKGLICSETGYTALAPEYQAAYIAKLYPTSIALGVESTMYYANVNPSWKHMGLIDWRTMSQKTLGYWAYKNASRALRDVKTVQPLQLAGVEGYRFERQDGSRVIVAWAPEKKADAPLAVTLPIAAGQWQLREATGRSLGTVQGPRATIKLTASPVWIDSDTTLAYAPPQPNPPLPHKGIGMQAAAADSVNENHGAAGAAIDLDTNTNWVSGKNKAAEAWLSVALRQAATVERLRVKTGPLPAGTWFDVEVSTDGKTFTPVATRQAPTSWNMEWVALKQPVRATHVRLRWHNPERKPATFSVFELELH